MKDRQGFGNRIKEMREHRNLTIEQAAELCDCSESTWKQYERGEEHRLFGKGVLLILSFSTDMRIVIAFRFRPCKGSYACPALRLELSCF